MASANRQTPWLKDVLRRAEAGSPAGEPPMVKVISLEAISLGAPERSSLRARFGIYAVPAEAELRRNGSALPPEDDLAVDADDGAAFEIDLPARLPRRLGEALAVFIDPACEKAFVLEAESAGPLTNASGAETTSARQASGVAPARVSVAELPEALIKSALMRQASAALPEDARR